MADALLHSMTIIAALLMLGLAVAHSDGSQPVNDLKDSLLRTAVVEDRPGQLTVKGLRFTQGQLQAWLLPRECYGHRPGDCGSATPLDYELTHASDGWTLRIPCSQSSQGHGQGPSQCPGFRVVSFWCEQCDMGATPATPFNGLVSTLHLRGQQSDFREESASSSFRSSSNSGGSGSVAVVLNKAWTLAKPVQQQAPDQQINSAAGTARRLQADSGCSLTVAGTAHTFDACPSVAYSNAPLQYFYSLSSDASGSSRTVLRGGIKVQGVGWAGWGLGSNQMRGTNAVIVKTDTSSSTGASVDGYTLPRGTATSAVNAAKGSWPVTDAAASLDSSGTLTAVFTVTLPSSVSSLTSGPYPYIYATGSVNSATGALREHDDYGPGSLTFTAPSSPQPSPSPQGATSAPPSVPSPSPSPSPPPSPAPAVVAPQPEASPSPSPAVPGGTADVTNMSGVGQQSCVLASGAGSQQFAACSSLTAALGQPFNLMWQVLPSSSSGGSSSGGGGSGGSRRLSQAGTTQVRFGLNGTTDGRGYVAVGFPTTAGQMTNSNAFILQDCSSCPSGASILGYWLAGTDQSDVNPPSHMLATNLTAARTTVNGASWLSGSFVVELPSSQVAAASTPLIFAVGSLSGAGTPQQHDTYGSGDVSLASGSVGSVEAGGQSQAKKDAHAWLMTISWGVMIPAGIVVARCFKELDPLWFKLHRAVQIIGFLLGIAGFGLGFSIRGSWSTPYAVHRNLGVAVMVLGTAQVTALFARPLQSSPWRRYWNWNHWWIGRAAGACAIANIYYGIVHVEALGAWAWATYTAVLGVIVAVWLVKDSVDYFQGRRTLLGAATKPAMSASQVELRGRGGSSDNGSNHSELLKGGFPASSRAEQFTTA